MLARQEDARPDPFCPRPPGYVGERVCHTSLLGSRPRLLDQCRPSVRVPQRVCHQSPWALTSYTSSGSLPLIRPTFPSTRDMPGTC